MPPQFTPHYRTPLTRRHLLKALAFGVVPLALSRKIHAAQLETSSQVAPLSGAVLPVGIRSRFVDGVNGLRMHVLEAGYESSGRPALLLVHDSR